MKYEWRKEEKEIYLPKTTPVLVDIPKAKYLCINGKGNPNNEDFQKRIQALYPLAYAIRMMPRNGYTPNNYFEYTVFPLEGIWDLSEKGRKEEKLNKNELIYTIMLKQPNFVNKEVINKAFEIAKNKNNNPLFEEVYFEEQEDGLSVQIMHIGSYDSEVESFNKMKKFIKENGLEVITLMHREIYISDFRKTDKDKLKTVLRYKVKKI